MKEAIFSMDRPLSLPSLGDKTNLEWTLQSWGMGSHRPFSAVQKGTVVRRWKAFSSTAWCR